MVLGTHYFLIGPLKLVLAKFLPQLESTSWHLFIVLLFVIVLEYPVIYLLRKYLPRYTAQEEFFHEGWKIKK